MKSTKLHGSKLWNICLTWKERDKKQICTGFPLFMLLIKAHTVYMGDVDNWRVGPWLCAPVLKSCFTSLVEAGLQWTLLHFEFSQHWLKISELDFFTDVIAAWSFDAERVHWALLQSAKQVCQEFHPWTYEAAPHMTLVLRSNVRVQFFA